MLLIYPVTHSTICCSVSFKVGRAVAVAALDLTNTNPWSRLASTEYGNVMGVRAWVQRYIRSVRGAPLLPKKMQRVASKTSRFVVMLNYMFHLVLEKNDLLVLQFCKQKQFGHIWEWV